MKLFLSTLGFNKMTDETFSWQQVIDHVIHIVVPISLGMVGYLFLQFVQHEVRLATIEAGKYAITEAHHDQKETNRIVNQRFDELFKEISHIRESLARLEGGKIRLRTRNDE